MHTPSLLFFFTIAVAPFLQGEKPADKPTPAAAPATVVPVQVLAPLEGIAHQLAKGAREREVKDLLNALERFGYPQANHDKLEKSTKDEIAKAKTPLDSLPSGAKQLRVTATQLVAIMDKITDEEEKKSFAKKILLLDGECEPAHKALGNVKVGKSWVNASLKELRERRGEILQKVTEAKKLEIEMVVEENVDDPYIQAACGTKATVVKYGLLELRSNFSRERTERMMREVQRAYALSNWIRKGDLSPMKAGDKRVLANTWILIDSRELHEKYTTAMAAENKLGPGDMTLLQKQEGKLPSFRIIDGPVVSLAQWEAETLAKLLNFCVSMKEGLTTPLTTGHMNWLALTCFGTTVPQYAVKDPKRRGGDTHVAGDEREREELMRLAKAGIQGSRTWMQYLTERGEDPAFGNSLVNSMGDITGNDLHKVTSVVEYLQEADTFGKLYDTLSKKAGEENPVTRYTKAMEMTFGELESKWREWLLGARPGVQERIDKENLAAWPKDALRVLDYMNSLRENAFKDKIKGTWKLKFDPDLSGPCDMHANYLVNHPEQKKWPDAHEEYADKEGYSVEGAWAGTHSVIAWGGIEDYKKSIDLWMGTFYHRLPLLDPGVMRLGWGQAGEWWVMDMSSLAAPYEEPYTVIWPYDGQKDVPCAFDGNEFPDPVPEKGAEVNEGEIFGYPITIQTKPIDEKGELVDIAMKLFEGDKEVECHFSSPSKPSNPESAPSGAWCLIPKKFLKSKTEYRVVADWRNSNKKTTSTATHLEWKFKTE